MKKYFQKLIAFPIIAIGFFQPLLAQQQNSNANAEQEQILKNIHDWEKRGATGDVEQILFYWTDDVMIMSPGQPTISGKEAARQMLEASKNIPGFKIDWDEPQSITVSKSGDLAYIISSNRITMNDSTGKAVTHYNKALAVWRKEADNIWKEAVVMFNENPAQSK